MNERLAAPALRVRRVFHWNGMELPDPDSSFSLQQVLDYYANQWPELLNAKISIAEGGITLTGTVRREVWDILAAPPAKPEQVQEAAATAAVPKVARVEAVQPVKTVNYNINRSSGTKG